MSNPSTFTLPDVAERQPVIMFMVVDLPAPLGPSSPYIFPFSMLNEMPRTAVFEPYFFTRSLTSIKSSSSCGVFPPGGRIPRADVHSDITIIL